MVLNIHSNLIGELSMKNALAEPTGSGTGIFQELGSPVDCSPDPVIVYNYNQSTGSGSGSITGTVAPGGGSGAVTGSGSSSTTTSGTKGILTIKKSKTPCEWAWWGSCTAVEYHMTSSSYQAI